MIMATKVPALMLLFSLMLLLYRSAENLRLIWVSEEGVAKLDSTSYSLSVKCGSRYVSCTCTKIGTHM